MPPAVACQFGAMGQGTPAPLSQASTTCASPHEDADGGDEDDKFRADFPGFDCNTHRDDSVGRHSEKWPEGAEERQRCTEVSQECAVAFSYDSSDNDGPDEDEEDDMHDLKHSGMIVGEDEMQARVADAMRGLRRLEHTRVDPRELPTIRALFVRWSIMQWALEGPMRGAQRPSMPQGDGLNEAIGGQTGIGQSLPASRCNKEQHSVSRQKRTRGDSERDRPGYAQLGTMRGSGCCIVKARRTGTPLRESKPHQPTLSRDDYDTSVPADWRDVRGFD